MLLSLYIWKQTSDVWLIDLSSISCWNRGLLSFPTSLLPIFFASFGSCSLLCCFCQGCCLSRVPSRHVAVVTAVKGMREMENYYFFNSLYLPSLRLPVHRMSRQLPLLSITLFFSSLSLSSVYFSSTVVLSCFTCSTLGHCVTRFSLYLAVAESKFFWNSAVLYSSGEQKGVTAVGESIIQQFCHIFLNQCCINIDMARIISLMNSFGNKKWKKNKRVSSVSYH